MLDGKISQHSTNHGPLIQSSNSSSIATNSSISSNSSLSLGKGQTIRGEIVDLRSNKVNVKLEDGKFLSGKLEGSVSLSIGQKVTFRVEDASQKNITLKLIPDNQYSNSDNTIDKALEAAGLGKTENTRTIVNELLNQQMSIDKKTISLVLQQSLLYKNSSIDNLVLMNKYRIPITEGNITQFEAYRSGEHGMMNQIEMLSDTISNLFSEIGNNPAADLLEQSSTVLNLLLNSKNPSEIDPSSSKITNVMNTDNQGRLIQNTPESADTIILTGSILNQSNNESLANTLSTLSIPGTFITQELIDSVKNGTANLREVANILNTVLENSAAISTDYGDASQKSVTNDTLETINAAAQNANNENAGDDIGNQQIISNTTLKDNPIVQKILNAYEDIQYNNNELGFFMPTSDRENLLSSLDSFPFSDNIKERIASGDISSKELLQLIQNNTKSVSEDTLSKLFSTKEFKTLIKEELTSKWSFTPNSLTKENEVNKHFINMASQLNELKENMEKASGNTNNPISGQANNLQENINFMKSLNDLFTYIQIPLKLKNQNAQSELYVYTRKKEGRTAEDGISVLLHLDMENLGPLDVHLDLNRNNVVGKFYLNNEDTINVISSHLPELEKALNNKGYSLNTEILERKKDIDIVEDFIKKDTGSPSVTRYNFDIRA